MRKCRLADCSIIYKYLDSGCSLTQWIFYEKLCSPKLGVITLDMNYSQLCYVGALSESETVGRVIVLGQTDWPNTQIYPGAGALRVSRLTPNLAWETELILPSLLPLESTFLLFSLRLWKRLMSWSCSHPELPTTWASLLPASNIAPETENILSEN